MGASELIHRMGILQISTNKGEIYMEPLLLAESGVLLVLPMLDSSYMSDSTCLTTGYFLELCGI